VAVTVLAAGALGDAAIDHRVAQRAFGFVVRRLDAIIVEEPEAGLGVGFDPLGQRSGLRPRPGPTSSLNNRIAGVALGPIAADVVGLEPSPGLVDQCPRPVDGDLVAQGRQVTDVGAEPMRLDECVNRAAMDLMQILLKRVMLPQPSLPGAGEVAA